MSETVTTYKEIVSPMLDIALELPIPGLKAILGPIKEFVDMSLEEDPLDKVHEKLDMINAKLDNMENVVRLAIDKSKLADLKNDIVSESFNLLSDAMNHKIGQNVQAEEVRKRCITLSDYMCSMVDKSDQVLNTYGPANKTKSGYLTDYIDAYNYVIAQAMKHFSIGQKTIDYVRKVAIQKSLEDGRWEAVVVSIDHQTLKLESVMSPFLKVNVKKHFPDWIKKLIEPGSEVVFESMAHGGNALDGTNENDVYIHATNKGDFQRWKLLRSNDKRWRIHRRMDDQYIGILQASLVLKGLFNDDLHKHVRLFLTRDGSRLGWKATKHKYWNRIFDNEGDNMDVCIDWDVRYDNETLIFEAYIPSQWRKATMTTKHISTSVILWFDDDGAMHGKWKII